MSQGSLWQCGALVAGVTLVSILQVGTWATFSMQAIHYFSSYISTTDWHQDSVQHALLDLSE